MGGDHSPKIIFRFMELLLARFRSGSEQGWRNGVGLNTCRADETEFFDRE